MPMRPLLLVVRHLPVATVLVGAAALAGIALALPLLAAFAPARDEPGGGGPEARV